MERAERAEHAAQSAFDSFNDLLGGGAALAGRSLPEEGAEDQPETDGDHGTGGPCRVVDAGIAVPGAEDRGDERPRRTAVDGASDGLRVEHRGDE